MLKQAVDKNVVGRLVACILWSLMPRRRIWCWTKPILKKVDAEASRPRRELTSSVSWLHEILNLCRCSSERRRTSVRSSIKTMISSFRECGFEEAAIFEGKVCLVPNWGESLPPPESDHLYARSSILTPCPVYAFSSSRRTLEEFEKRASCSYIHGLFDEVSR